MKIRESRPARDPDPNRPVFRSALLDKRFVPPVRKLPRTPGTLHLPHIVRAAQKHA